MIRTTISEEDSKIIMVEIFKRVGLTEQDYDAFDFTEPEWFKKHLWSQEEEETFVEDWLGPFLVKNKYASKGKYRGVNAGVHEAQKMMINYGWSYKPEQQAEKKAK